MKCFQSVKYRILFNGDGIEINTRNLVCITQCHISSVDE